MAFYIEIDNPYRNKKFHNVTQTMEEMDGWLITKKNAGHFGDNEREVVKGEEEYNTDLVLSERSEEYTEDGEVKTRVIVSLKAEYTYEIQEIDDTSTNASSTTNRIANAIKKGRKYKRQRINGGIVVDYFIFLINQRGYSVDDKVAIQSNAKIQLGLGLLTTGNLPAAKQVLKDMRATSLIKRSDLNKCIKLINDLLRKA